MMNQREAVYTAICTVLGEDHGVVTNEGLSRTQKEQIHSIVVKLFLDKKVDLKGNRSQEWIVKYVPGLVNNWVRKDKRLNGGEAYVTKNPGSRTGSGDAQLKAMKALLEMTTDPTNRAEIQKAIDARVAELAPKPKEVDMSVLPDHLKKFVQLS